MGGRVVSCRVAVVAFPNIQIRARGANLNVAVRPARTRAPGARAQPGPDKIAPRGRNFASYPLLVIYFVQQRTNGFSEASATPPAEACGLPRSSVSD